MPRQTVHVSLFAQHRRNPHCRMYALKIKFGGAIFLVISIKSLFNLSLAGAFWKPIRKLLNPSFNLKILQSFVPIFNDKTNIMLDNLEAEVGKKNFDVSQYMFACTLDMVCGEWSALGGVWFVKRKWISKIDLQRPQWASTWTCNMTKIWNYWKALKCNLSKIVCASLFILSFSFSFSFLVATRICEIVGKRFIQFWTHPNFIFRWTDLYRIQAKHIHIIDRLTGRVRFKFCSRLTDHIFSKFQSLHRFATKRK